LSRIVDGDRLLSHANRQDPAWKPDEWIPAGEKGQGLATIPLRIDQPANRRMTALCLAGKARNSGLATSICLKVAGMLRHVANLLHRPL